MSKLDVFTPTKYSDNRVIVLPEEKIDDIIIGATCTHIFHLGFKYSEYVKSSKVIYKQGLDVILTKYPISYNLEETKYGTTFLTLVLTPEDTIKFRDAHLTTTVQIQITNVNGETLYNIPSKLIVKEPLSVERYTPTKLEKVKDFVWYVESDNYNYNEALQYFYSNSYLTAQACSAIRANNYFGRNYDSYNNFEVSFITKCTGKKYKSISVSSGNPKFTDDYLDEYKYSDDYKLIPFFSTDGINEKGVICAINAVACKDMPGEIYSSHASIQARQELSSQMVVRYVLDNFESALDAVLYLRDYVEIIVPDSLQNRNISYHWIIADEQDTFVVEMLDDRLVILQNQNVLTSFYLAGVELNEDGTVYTPFDVSWNETYLPTFVNNIKQHSIGLERYNLLWNHLEEASESSEAMRELINKAWYGKAYDRNIDFETMSNESPFYTEWVGEYEQENHLTKDLTVNDSVMSYETTGTWEHQIDASQMVYYPSMLNYKNELFRKGKMHEQNGTLLSVSSSVYDIKNRKLSVIFQENNEELNYTL